MNEDIHQVVAVHHDHHGNRYEHVRAGGLHSVFQTHEHGSELGKPYIHKTGTEAEVSSYWNKALKEEIMFEEVDITKAPFTPKQVQTMLHNRIGHHQTMAKKLQTQAIMAKVNGHVERYHNLRGERDLHRMRAKKAYLDLSTHQQHHGDLLESTVNEHEWSDIPSYAHAGLAHAMVNHIHAHIRKTGKHPSEEEQAGFRKKIADNYRQRHPRGTLGGTTHPQETLKLEGHGAFADWARENKANRAKDRATDKAQQAAKALAQRTQKQHLNSVHKHHNELIKNVYKAEHRGSQEEWEDAVAAVADHQRKHPHLKLPGHLGESANPDADDFKPEDANKKFAEDLKRMTYDQAMKNAEKPVKEDTTQLAQKLNSPENIVGNCSKCTKHAHSMIASGINADRAYQLAAAQHKTHTTGLTIESIKGWKNAHSDLAKMRRRKHDAEMPVTLVRLNRDGSERKMFDSHKNFKSEADALAHHDYLKQLNPTRSIGHNLYVNGEHKGMWLHEGAGGGGLGGGTVPNTSITAPGKKFKVLRNPPLVREADRDMTPALIRYRQGEVEKHEKMAKKYKSGDHRHAYHVALAKGHKEGIARLTRSMNEGKVIVPTKGRTATGQKPNKINLKPVGKLKQKMRSYYQNGF